MRLRFLAAAVALAVLAASGDLCFGQAAPPGANQPPSIPEPPDKLPKNRVDQGRNIDFLFEALKVAPDEHGKLGLALAGWRNRATAAFLAAYRETAANQRLWPADPQSARQILNFFLLEKAIYEIEYELSHRPEWLRVALTGILRILSKQPFEAA